MTHRTKRRYPNTVDYAVATAISGKHVIVEKPLEITLKRCDKIILDSTKIRKSLDSFLGTISQIPPYYSAKKINNVKMYDLARKQIFVRLKPVKVTIDRIRLVDFIDNYATIEVECKKGTYIRSLARDIAYANGTFGYLESLTRTSVGEFDMSNSVDYKDLEECNFIN